MAWPPPVLPINRLNATPQQDTHPADHNAANQAINDLVAQVSDILIVPTQRHRAAPVVTNPVYSYANLAELTIPAAPRERVALVSCHLQLTVSTLTPGTSFNVGIYVGASLLQLWTIAATGEHWIDASADAVLPAGADTTIIVNVGALPAGVGARTWGSDYINYLSAVTTRGAAA